MKNATSLASPVFDLHCDAVLKLVHRNAHFANDNPVSHIDIPKMKQGGVNGVFYSLWADPVFQGELAVERTKFMMQTALKEIESCSKDLFLSTNRNHLDESLAQNKITAMLGIEGGVSINNNLNHLRYFYEHGVRRMTLTHTISTNWAGSSGDDGNTRGLTSFGEDVVRLMNKLGMVVDVAHTSEQTVLDAARVTTKPLFCSHSCVRAKYNHPRLASDAMIKAVGETGGIFGVTMVPLFFGTANEKQVDVWMQDVITRLGNKTSKQGMTLEEEAQEKSAIFMDAPFSGNIPSVKDVLPHIDHVISLIGEDHVGIGTDFDGCPFGPADLANASKFDVLRDAMKGHGYSDVRIRKIMGENVRRVLKEIL